MSRKVQIPSPLRSYTGGAGSVTASGATLAAVLQDLDRSYPGIRFRMIDEQDQIRRHIRLFVNAREAQAIDVALQPADELHIVCALSGG
jgi:molybdopterin converting factor small subunit